MELKELLRILKDLDISLSGNVLALVWAIYQIYKQVSKVNFSQAFEMEERIVKNCELRCEEIAETFGADRCLYWQVANGEKFLDRWPKKKLVALAEYYRPGLDLQPFKRVFGEVSTMRFDRNVKALLQSHGLLKSSTRKSLVINYGREGADIQVYKGAIFVGDESRFDDEVSAINLEYGWGALAACFCTDRRGKLIGFLVIGFKEPREFNAINMTLFKDQGRTFYKSIANVTAHYSIHNRILRRILKSRQ